MGMKGGWWGIHQFISFHFGEYNLINPIRFHYPQLLGKSFANGKLSMNK